MRRIALVTVSCSVLIIAPFVASLNASAAVRVAGLEACRPGPECHLGPVDDAFPNYKSVCSLEDCTFVSAANYLEVAMGITPTAALLHQEYVDAGQRFNGGLSLANLWNYWKSSGIDGVYLVNDALVSRTESPVVIAIRQKKAVIAELVTKQSTLIGTASFGSGTAIVIADGYTPKGPLLVYQGHTLQMTWAQWLSQAKAVWQLTLTTTVPPTTSVASSPTSSAPSATLALSPAAVPSTGSTVTMTFSSQNATSCALSSTPSFWTSTSVGVNCNGTYSITVAATTTQQQWIFTFSASGPSGQTATASQTLIQAAPSTTAQNLSINWSGYVVPSSSTLVTDAQGEWTVPSLNCSDTPSGSVSIWVGIGGEQWSTGGSSGSLLQSGVEDDCDNGVQHNYGWWEIYPSTPNYEEPFTNFPVATGDQMESTIYETTSGAWETQLSDLTTGMSGYMITGQSWGVGRTSSGRYTIQGSTSRVSYSGGYTAEWIVEDPGEGGSGGISPFVNFGTVTFTNLESSFSSWSLTNDEIWAIEQNGVQLAAPIETTSDGFTVGYTGR